jgi:hypothetical protein
VLKLDEEGFAELPEPQNPFFKRKKGFYFCKKERRTDMDGDPANPMTTK